MRQCCAVGGDGVAGSAGRRTLVGLRQAESGDGGGYEEGAAADNPCGTGVKHQPAV